MTRTEHHYPSTNTSKTGETNSKEPPSRSSPRPDSPRQNTQTNSRNPIFCNPKSTHLIKIRLRKREPGPPPPKPRQPQPSHARLLGALSCLHHSRPAGTPTSRFVTVTKRPRVIASPATPLIKIKTGCGRHHTPPETVSGPCERSSFQNGLKLPSRIGPDATPRYPSRSVRLS